MTTRALTIYLRDHEAAGRAGADLFDRVVRGQRRRPWAAEVAELRTEVREDLAALRRLMAELQVQPDPVLRAAARTAERLARFKPNGHLLRRSPLSDLIEIEGALDAVNAKGAGWRALIAAGVPARGVELEVLASRAEHQLVRLRELHRTVAARVLTDRGPR